MKWFGIAYNIQMARWGIQTIVWKPETWDLRLETGNDLSWQVSEVASLFSRFYSSSLHKQYLVNITCTIVAQQWQQRTYFFPIN